MRSTYRCRDLQIISTEEHMLDIQQSDQLTNPN